MSDFRNFSEIIYFITAGPILTILVAVGLWQLKIAKDNARMTAKRESYKLAADQCSYYLCHIIPLQNKLDEAINKNKVTFFDKAVFKIDGNKIHVKLNSNKDDIQKMLTVGHEILDVCNSMEAFSLFFISGVADEKAAFSAVGSTFCNTVRKLLPQLVISSGDGHFKNLMQLFFLWNTRIESLKLSEDKQKIEDKLKSIDNKTIKPLGTE